MSSEFGERSVFFKREDTHELGAFKWRGALPVVDVYLSEGASTVVTASTGNHGAATAWAAARAGLSAVVFAPEGASATKLERLDALGAEIRLVGVDLDEAKEHGKVWAAESGLPFFEDGAEPAQYAGYGTIAQEILDELGRPPAAVVVPVGNGALIGGIGLVLHERGTACIGAVAAAAPVMASSWQAGRPVETDECDTIADGLAVRVAIPHAVTVLDEVVDEMILISEREIATALGRLAELGLRVEAAAAAALAAFDRMSDDDGPIVLLMTGRNIDDELYERAVSDPGSFPS